VTLKGKDGVGAVEPTTALRTPPPEPPPPMLRWGQLAAALVGALAIALGLLHIVSAPTTLLAAAVIGGAVLTVAVCFCGWRTNQRRTATASLATVVGQLLRAPVVVQRVRWRGIPIGQIVRLRVQHTELAAAVYGPQLGWRITQALQQVTGRAFIVHRHQQRTRQMLLIEKSAQPQEEQTELDKQRLRVNDVTAESFGVDATVKNVKTTDTLVTEFTVHYRSAAKAMTVPAVRRRTTIAVGERLTGMWKAQFALEGDTVTFKRRPPLPTYVPRPATPAPVAGDGAYSLIPQGVDEDGQVVNWDISGVMSHFLRAGRTRTGKSLQLSTTLPTPSGWTTMGELRAGDRIFDEAGRPTTVTGVYDQPPDRPCVEVTFSDGSKIVCDEEHLWWTETRAARISYQQARRDRERATALTPAVVADLRRRADSSSPSDTLSLSEVTPLLHGEASQVWLYEIAKSLTPVDVVGQEHWFSYRAQTVRQRHQVQVYDAMASYQALAELAHTGRFPKLTTHAATLDDLAAHTLTSATLTRQDVARRLGVADWQAGRWLQSTGLAMRREERIVELEVAAKQVRRSGRPGRRFDTAELLTALAEAGIRILNDQRHRHIHGSVKTTRQIADTLHTTTGHLNHSIPVAAALQLPALDLLVPPYTLGAFLGDGNSYTTRLTSADPEIVARIEADGYETVQVKQQSDSWKLCRDYKILGLRPQLKQLGILKRRPVGPSAKRIPPQYLRASEEQRRALLAGLLDTDGTVAPQGTVQYTTILAGLADDVHELAISLGYRATCIEGRATLYGRDIGPKWTIAFTTDDPVFGLSRKLQAQRERTADHSPARVKNRTIVSVRPVPSVPVRCISVDSPNHLYLVGRTMIPTHNTVTVIGDAIECARRNMPVFVVDPKRVEFMGLRSWPNVQYVATTVQQQIALIYKLKLEMDERYRMVEEEGFSDSEFQPILLIIDEYRQLYGNVQAWWKSIKVTGMPAECPIFEWIGALLRMAAYCRIHVDLATQRPDAAFLGGEALALETPIPTPSGWSTMGDLQIGEEVFDERGRPTRVVDTTEVMHGRPCFKITFTDQSTVVADEDHLWVATAAAQHDNGTLAGRNRSLEDLNRQRRDGAAERATIPHPGHSTGAGLDADPGGGRSSLQRQCHPDGRRSVRPADVRPRGSGLAPVGPSSQTTPISELLVEAVSPGAAGRRIVTTAQLAGAQDTCSGAHTWNIETTQPLQLPEAELPIDPWLLGYWLVNGHRAAAIATGDSEVLDRIRTLGYRVSRYGRLTYGIHDEPGAGCNRSSLPQSFHELGLLDNKQVPQTYRRASERQRRELLAGLLDAGGVCAVRPDGTPSGEVTFTNADYRLSEAVLELVTSLGIVSTVRRVSDAGIESSPESVVVGRRSEPAWVVSFTPDEQVFGIGRKQQELVPALPTVAPRRWRQVVSVERIDSVPVRCITVATDSHLYLAGTACIPTHNCRDNFSARAATGRLSPDGAEMMFDTVHVGVNIPLNVRGRGTIVGVDDQPKEVQFFYTPDPRRPRDDEDRALLAHLRPVEARWPALTLELPDAETFADEIPDGKKTNLEWEQLLRARFEPSATIEPTEPEPLEVVNSPSAADQESGQGVDQHYREPSKVPAGMVSVGDLLNLDDGIHGWVTVTDLVRDDASAGHGEIQFEWSDDDGGVGDLIIGRGELLEIRRPH
jgi:hypothetical protein